jgi:hypothetical protein
VLLRNRERIRRERVRVVEQIATGAGLAHLAVELRESNQQLRLRRGRGQPPRELAQRGEARALAVTDTRLRERPREIQARRHAESRRRGRQLHRIRERGETRESVVDSHVGRAQIVQQRSTLGSGGSLAR